MGEEEGEGVIAVATAAVDNDNVGVDFVTPYGCYGILPRGVGEDVVDRAPLHLVIKAYAFNEIASRLNGLLTEIERNAKARLNESALAGANLEGDDFLVI